jgi:outer membrane biosynthesis protein TonB
VRALWLVPALALTLTACGAEPREELRGDVEAVTLAANDRDPDAVRQAVQDLLSTIRAQVGSGDLDGQKGDRLRQLAERIAKNADALTPAATPTPTPTPEKSEPPPPEPTPEPSPTPSPEPEEPEQTQEPSPPPKTQEPPPPSPVVEIFPDESPTPAQMSQPGSGASSAGASPAA